MKKIIYILTCLITLFCVDSVKAEFIDEFKYNLGGDWSAYARAAIVTTDNNTCELRKKSSNDNNRICEYYCNNSISVSDFNLMFQSEGDDELETFDAVESVIKCDEYGCEGQLVYTGDKKPWKHQVVTDAIKIDVENKNFKEGCPGINSKAGSALYEKIGSIKPKFLISFRLDFQLDETKDIYIFPDSSDIVKDEDLTDGPCSLLGGDDSELVEIIKDLYNLIKIVIPLLIVVLGITDFIKVVVTGKNEDMSKAINKLFKRIVLGCVFVFVPIIISLLIDLSGVSVDHEQIGTGMKTIFCILG